MLWIHGHYQFGVLEINEAIKMAGKNLLVLIGNWIAPKFKILELTLISLIFVGISLRIAHIEFGELILILSLNLISILYFLNSFSDKGIPMNSPILSFINKLLGFSCSLFFLGILFRINHYAGWNQMLIIATGTFILLVPFSLYWLYKDKELKGFFRPRIIKSIAYSINGLLLILTPPETF